MSNLHSPGIVICCPISRHLVESNPHSQPLGKPTAISRSFTLTGESFSAMKLKTIFDSPVCTGITIHPSGMLRKRKEPLGRFPALAKRPVNKKSFVKDTLASGEAPNCRESTKCGRGFGRSGIRHETNHGTKVITVKTAAMTKSLFQTLSRLYLWNSVIFQSLKFTNWTDTGNSWTRTAAMTACNSSRLLPFTRTASP